MRLIRKIVEGWRAFATVPQAPPKLNALLIQCLEVEPQDRPTFERILSELCGPIKSEIDEGNYDRLPNDSHDDPPGLDADSERGGGPSGNVGSGGSDGSFGVDNPADHDHLRAASMMQQQAVAPVSRQASQGALPSNLGSAEKGQLPTDSTINPMARTASQDDDESYFSPGASLRGRPSELSQIVVTTCTDL